VKKLPTYQELAALVTELTEVNIANLERPEYRFVSCFTYGADRIPDHWWRAIETREALIEQKIVPRGKRQTAKAILRNRKGKQVRA
jgi:hypothetical protein